jgi:predicted dehydrogenase/threonine dehydrogenase-like Zn-dependent dehydrogenase
MKQVIQSARNGKLTVRDVPAPQATPGTLLVATRASLISAGTERLTTAFAKKSLAGKAKARPDLVRKVFDKARREGLEATFQAVMARLDEPLPLGYSAAGTVVAVGAGLEGRFRVGQAVAIAGAGLANHAELDVVPANLAAPIPDGVSFEEASFATLAAIALHGIRNLGTGLGDVVAVVGAGLVGQLAAAFVTLSGGRAVVLDYDQARLKLATKMGAEAVWNLSQPGAADMVRGLSGGLGADGVLIAAATDSDEPFETTADLARDRARVSLVGLTGTRFPFREYMQKELTIVVSRSYGPGRYDTDFENMGVKYPPGYVRWTETENLAESLRLMAPGRSMRLDVTSLISHRFPIKDAAAAYDLITERSEPCLGVVLTYAEGAVAPARRRFSAPAAAPGRCVLGIIGAGNFARSVLLPELKRLKGVDVVALTSGRGAQAEQTAREFGVPRAETDANAIIDDPIINAVLIATRHGSHAELTARALAAGKSVLVEKPLGLTMDEIEHVAAARDDAKGFFQVGFNRRFAPLSRSLLASLNKIPGPRFMVIRINAGAVEGDSWVLDPQEGGGRILGEMCHFVDLARFFVGQPIVSVQADCAASDGASCQDATAMLRFADGSLATIAYTALGDSGASKERIEAYAGGAAAVLEDFKHLTIQHDGKNILDSKSGQDKGIRAELEAFTAAVAKGAPAPINEAVLIETSRATVAVLESLRSGMRVDL